MFVAPKKKIDSEKKAISIFLSVKRRVIDCKREIQHRENKNTSLSNVFKVTVKVRVIETNMSMYAMHKSTVMPSLK